MAFNSQPWWEVQLAFSAVVAASQTDFKCPITFWESIILYIHIYLFNFSQSSTLPRPTGPISWPRKTYTQPQPWLELKWVNLFSFLSFRDNEPFLLPRVYLHRFTATTKAGLHLAQILHLSSLFFQHFVLDHTHGKPSQKKYFCENISLPAPYNRKILTQILFFLDKNKRAWVQLVALN